MTRLLKSRTTSESIIKYETRTRKTFTILDRTDDMRMRTKISLNQFTSIYPKGDFLYSLPLPFTLYLHRLAGNEFYFSEIVRNSNAK